MALRSMFAAGCLIVAWSGAPAFAATAAPPTPEVIAPGDLPSFQPILRSDSPSARVAAADAPAPMPDVDASAPVRADDGTAQVSPALFNTKTQYRGDGYGAGSTAQDVEERSAIPAGGLRLKLPLN